MFPYRRSLFVFDAHVSASMRRGGEVTVSVSILLVYMLLIKRDCKRKPSSALIGSGETTKKLGNKHGDRVCIE